MANPTFDGMELTTDAAAEQIGSPAARVFAETVPGVSGEFMQVLGRGGRDIVVTGLYRGPAATTPDFAQAALKAALRRLGAKVGQSVGVYVGADAQPYPTCVLKSCQPVGPVRHIRAGANYQAVAAVRAVVRDLNP
jgi:hypothetical protein